MSEQIESALVPVDDAQSVQLGALDVAPDQVVAKASAIATMLANVIRDRRLALQIQGKEYVRVEGWETLGAMLGIVAQEESVTELEDGSYEAVVRLVRVGDGQMIGRGSALCGTDEARWRKADRYARRSMAITRATGKAFRTSFSWIMALAGYEPTPLEEMPGPEGNGVSIERPRRAAAKPKAVVAALAEPERKRQRPARPITEGQERLLWARAKKRSKELGLDDADAAATILHEVLWRFKVEHVKETDQSQLDQVLQALDSYELGTADAEEPF